MRKIIFLLLLCVSAQAQDKVVVNENGSVSYYFASGAKLENTVAAMDGITSISFAKHHTTTHPVQDSFGIGKQWDIEHSDDKIPFHLIQHIRVYPQQMLVSVEAIGNDLETRDISPLLVKDISVPGNDLRILDVPFDNDEWTRVNTPKWPGAKGTSYEFSSIYDQQTMEGIVIGSITHDFWKTGIVYGDTIKVYGGISTPDKDGTHDHAPHGTMKGNTLTSPLIYLAGTNDIRKAFVAYGNANVTTAGRLTWKGYAPVYWNSFGVEGVLGYSKVMMPTGVIKIADFIHSMENFNKYAKPVLSIDSYDQSIYTTELLASLGRYGKKKNEQMGFYFIPFAIWTWKNSIDQQMIGNTMLQDMVLRDKDHHPIAYKDGDWGAYAIDPTHPATREYIIKQLQKAKAINATFIKIDFLTAGALESTTRYNKSVRSGMQAYNAGMKMLKGLVDSIMGPDVFITQAISPMFPHQYAHTRFISTDVYSHLRDDQPGFPHYGSTEASLSAGSHLWWVQGTLWPYTNLDVAIMKHFQQNPDLSEQEIKVRIYAMMTMGSILGDGSDFRDKLAVERAKKFLDNADVCAFFSQPKVFTPLRMSDGETMDQQMSFYLKSDTSMVSLFNFDTKQPFKTVIAIKDLGMESGRYMMKDFLTGASLGEVTDTIAVTVPVKDAIMIKLVKIWK